MRFEYSSPGNSDGDGDWMLECSAESAVQRVQDRQNSVDLDLAQTALEDGELMTNDTMRWVAELLWHSPSWLSVRRRLERGCVVVRMCGCVGESGQVGRTLAKKEMDDVVACRLGEGASLSV